MFAYPIHHMLTKYVDLIGDITYDFPNDDEIDLNRLIVKFETNGNQRYIKFLPTNKQYETEEINAILNHVCKALSYTALLCDDNYFHHLTYFYTPRIPCESGISISKKFDIPTDKFKKIYASLELGNKDVDFFFDIIYRALRCVDLEARYFTLFTLIEFIEKKHAKDFDKLLNEEELKKTKDSLSKCGLKHIPEEKFTRIFERLCGTLSNITVNSRAEKLVATLSNHYGFSKDCFGTLNIQSFIDTRNHLFHGRNENSATLEELTNKLLSLCTEIVSYQLNLN